MAPLGVGLTDGHAQNEPPIQLGVREIEISAAVERVHQFLIEFVAPVQPETDKVKGWRDHEFKALVLADPGGKLLRKPDMLANVELQTLNAVIPQHKPQFERTEAAAELDVPVSIVDHFTGFGSLVAQVFG